MKHTLLKTLWPIMFLSIVTQNAFAALPDAAKLKKMIERFTSVELKVDLSALSPADHKALPKIIEAARVMNQLFLIQLWSGNPDLKARLEKDKSEEGTLRLRYFQINEGPWSELDEYAAFLPGVPPKKLPGANFYPEGMTKEEFESWVKGLPNREQENAKGFFSVIRRGPDRKLKLIPYSTEYGADLRRAAMLLKEAAALTDNGSLRKFLNLRAEAFLKDDYYESDVAWMDLDAPIEVTIGPYETYQDEIFGYKAAFEAFVTLRDDRETQKLKSLSGRLQEIEDHLPIDPEFRNPKIGAMAPIRVVNQLLAAGDANHGVKTAAFNLPNDERVVREKGSKRVMLKNIQEEKFQRILTPISKHVLSKGDQKDLSFDSFFTHILAHELSHGIGPQQIKLGKTDSTPRKELKELYGAIEEAKADVTSLFMLQYLFDHGNSPGLKGGAANEKRLYTTFLASTFRTLRFGSQDAHGKGMALQLNYLVKKGGFKVEPTGTFSVDLTKIKDAVRDLTHDLLMLEVTGDYPKTQKMLAEYSALSPEVKKALKGLTKIPTDIDPIPVTANELVPDFSR